WLSVCEEKRGHRCVLPGGRSARGCRSRGLRVVHRGGFKHRSDCPPTQRSRSADALWQESMGALESVGDATQPGVRGSSGLWENGTCGAQTSDTAAAAEGRLLGPVQRQSGAAEGSMD